MWAETQNKMRPRPKHRMLLMRLSRPLNHSDSKHTVWTYAQIYNMRSLYDNPVFNLFNLFLSKNVCFFYPSRGPKKPTVKRKTSITCKKQRLYGHLIVQLYTLHFHQRGVMDWAVQCMVKWCCITCMGRHSLPRNVTQQEMA